MALSDSCTASSLHLEKELFKQPLRKKLIDQSKSCFKSESSLVWLGFSNGGNHIAQFFQTCGSGEFLVFGASGGYVKPWRKSLSECGRFWSIIGTEDKWNYRSAVKFVDLMKKYKGNARSIEFPGGHEIKLKPLDRLISEILH